MGHAFLFFLYIWVASAEYQCYSRLHTQNVDLANKMDAGFHALVFGCLHQPHWQHEYLLRQS